MRVTPLLVPWQRNNAIHGGKMRLRLENKLGMVIKNGKHIHLGFHIILVLYSVRNAANFVRHTLTNLIIFS